MRKTEKQIECEHSDICHDERICLDCDLDMSEELQGKADYAKEQAMDRKADEAFDKYKFEKAMKNGAKI